MQGRIFTADSFETNNKLKLIKLNPVAPGEARMFTKLRAAGIKTLDLRFSDDLREIILVIPKHVSDMPDSVGRGPRKKKW